MRCLQATDPNSYAAVALLESLQGALIPFGGQAVIAGLDSKRPDVMLKAIHVLPGVMEPDACAGALDRALAGYEFSGLIVAHVRSIPTAYPGCEAMAARAAVSDSWAGGFIELGARTLRQDPSHSVRPWLEACLERVISKWEQGGGQEESVYLACIDNVDVWPTLSGLAEALRRGVDAYLGGEDGETLAEESMQALWSLEGAGASGFFMDLLRARLPTWLQDLTGVWHTFREIMKGMGLHAPAQLPVLIEMLEQARTDRTQQAVDELREIIVGVAALQGVLIYQDHVVDPHGRAVPAAERSALH